MSEEDGSSASAIKDVLVHFLKSFTQNNALKYREAISSIRNSRRRSITVDMNDLTQFEPNFGRKLDLVYGLRNQPKLFLPLFDDALLEVLKIEADDDFVEKEKHRIRVRLGGLPDEIPLRKLDASFYGKIVKVSGLIIRSYLPKLRIAEAAFVCENAHINAVHQDHLETPQLEKPMKCEAEGCGATARSLSLNRDLSKWDDFERVWIQEPPEELGGQTPTTLEAFLFGDSISIAGPGDRVNITAIWQDVRTTSEGEGSSVQDGRLFVNNIELARARPEDMLITKEESEQFEAFAASPGSYDRLIASVNPSILGHEMVKEAALFNLVSSPRVKLPDGDFRRGDIHVLIVGEPGLSKSELLKYIARASARGLYAHGAKASGPGVNCSIVKEEKGTLAVEPGSAVLCNDGNLCVDNLDKLQDKDSNALDEVLEQQTVTIHKAGFRGTFPARVSVVAAMNPTNIHGKYDPYKGFYENVQLRTALLERFDWIFILRDEPDKARDEQIANHVAHLRATSSFPVRPSLPYEFLKKYILYGKKIDPELTTEASDLLRDYWIKKRQESSPEGIQVSIRMFEGFIRSALACARLRLHRKVADDDARRVIMLADSMFNSVYTDPATKKIDIGVLYGKPVSERGLRELALDTFKRLLAQSGGQIEDKIFYDEIKKTGKFTRELAIKVFQDMWKSGIIYEVRAHYFKKA